MKKGEPLNIKAPLFMYAYFVKYNYTFDDQNYLLE